MIADLFSISYLFSDFPTLLDKVHKDNKGVEGSKPRLERVPVCTCIQVTGLKEKSSDDTIWLYFENEKRSGGKDVQMVERKWKDEVLVFFEDHSSEKSIINLLMIDRKTPQICLTISVEQFVHWCNQNVSNMKKCNTPDLKEFQNSNF